MSFLRGETCAKRIGGFVKSKLIFFLVFFFTNLLSFVSEEPVTSYNSIV